MSIEEDPESSRREDHVDLSLERESERDMMWRLAVTRDRGSTHPAEES